MDADIDLFSVDHVSLEFRDVVGHVVHNRNLGVRIRNSEDATECASHSRGNRLSICPREVGRRGHRPQVRAAFGRFDRDTGELTVRNADPIALHRLLHHGQRILAHLVAKTA